MPEAPARRARLPRSTAQDLSCIVEHVIVLS